jgi:hypothetical protein
MINLDAFNGLWVVCEANYAVDPAPDSFYRSAMYFSGDVTGEEEIGWFVPLFTDKNLAEQCRSRVCQALNHQIEEFKVVHIISLRHFADLLRGFLKLGRFHVRFDDGEPARIEPLLHQVVQRLI